VAAPTVGVVPGAELLKILLLPNDVVAPDNPRGVEGDIRVAEDNRPVGLNPGAIVADHGVVHEHLAAGVCLNTGSRVCGND
jgi:hypothetical protein